MVKNYKMKSIPKKYVPRSLSPGDKRKQKAQIEESQKLYKDKIYKTRDKVDSFKSKRSDHLAALKEIYGIEKIEIGKELALKTGCSVEALEKIMKKGQGAYYSSGSRPNQTAHSWGLARVASAVTGGKASVVDLDIIREGCSENSKAYLLALEAKRKKNKKV